MKIAAIFFLCILACVQSLAYFSLLNQEWNNFKFTFGKRYLNAYEEYKRMKFYMENSEKIINHNLQHALGLIPYKLEMNQFGDIRVKEFALTRNGLRTKSLLNLRNFAEAGINFIPPANVELPDHVDWRTLGAVTEVKDQRRCASCWSFATTGALEGQHFRKTNKLVNLSEQNLIDCSTSFGNHGCQGGLMTNAYNYIKANNGIDNENSYPYLAEDRKCAYNANYSGATDRGYAIIESGNEEALKAAVATVGPISVGIDASHRSFQFYKEGIHDDSSCRNGSLDHAVLVVGYGTTEKGADYWIVKNSWGSMWGIDGYILMARNKGNHCGIATLASYPLV